MSLNPLTKLHQIADWKATQRKQEMPQEAAHVIPGYI